MIFKNRVCLLAFILGAFSIGGCATPHQMAKENATQTEDKKIYYWTSANGGGGVVLRAISDHAEKCPSLRVGENIIDLLPRVEPSREFPDLVCEIQLTRNSDGQWQIKPLNNISNKYVGKGPSGRTILFENLNLPRRGERIARRVVIMGDTGCRIKVTEKGAEVQECHNPDAWPFASVAAQASRVKAETVIHLGDYHYREAPCPEGYSGCRGVSSGDTGASWREDFLEPAAPLLLGTNWVFVRGNHESCERSKEGWFRYLDPRPYSQLCSNSTPPYVVPFGRRSIVVGDAVEEKNIQGILDWIEVQNNLKGQKIWLLLHRPILTPGTLKLRWPKKNQIELVMSGHFHELSMNDFDHDKPLEFIVGNGGSSLTPPTPSKFNKFQYSGFGYVVLESLGGEGIAGDTGKWILRVSNYLGKQVGECLLTAQATEGRKLSIDNCKQLQ